MLRKIELWISLLIVVVMGLHVVPILQKFQGESQTLWPIMAWGMYKRSFPAPVQSLQQRLVGITESGQTHKIYAWQSGLSPFAFKRLYLVPMMEGNADAAQHLATQLNRHYNEPIVSLRLEGTSYTLTDVGLVKEDVPAIVYNTSN
jgi:hypothetical protein